MQKRLSLSLAFTLAGTMTLGCGKSSSDKASEDKPQKPTITMPTVNPGTTPLTPSSTETATQPPKTDPVTKPENQPTVPPVVVVPPVNKPPVIVNQPTVSKGAVIGLWSLSIAQNPRSCSTIYDLRDSNAAAVHLLCPSLKGGSISLQTETFSRTSDDGQKATWKRLSSTCSNSAGTVFLSYALDSKNNLVLNEGSKASPVLLPLAESNYASDLKSASTLHGRPIVRGCFQSGNLEAFATKGAAQ